jgi:hypothetical protein
MKKFLKEIVFALMLTTATQFECGALYNTMYMANSMFSEQKGETKRNFRSCEL